MSETNSFVIGRFSPQASQFEGMGAAAAGNSQEALDTFGEATHILANDSRKIDGQPIDMRYICFEATSSELSQNHLTQLAVCVSNEAARRRLKAEQPGININMRAGHSVGEYNALVGDDTPEDILRFEDALLLVDERARRMSEAGRRTGEGGIGVVLGIELKEVEEAAREAGVFIANHNSPSQTGVSGYLRNLGNLEQAFGRRYRQLPMSLAVHSPYMDWAADHLSKYIGEGHMFNRYSRKFGEVVLNLAGRQPGSIDEIIQGAPLQIINTVLWQESMEAAIARGQATNSRQIVLVEIGPKNPAAKGQVLTGIDQYLAKKHENVIVADFETALETGLDPEALAAR